MSNDPTSKTLDNGTLRHLYSTEELTMQQIADRYGVTRQRIQQRLREIGVFGVRRRKRLDPDALHSLYAISRLRKEDVARHLGTTVHVVDRELKRHGIVRPKIEEHLSSLYSREQIDRLYVEEALTQVECARRLGVSPNAFRKLLVYYAVEHRHHGWRPPKYAIDSKDLLRLYVRQKHTMTSIAELFGCSLETIRYRLTKLGVPIERWRRQREKS